MNTSVVVPNHGRDLTKLKASLPKGTELIEVNLGRERSYQRNYGIKQATKKYVLYLDSDQFLSPGVIEECEMLCELGVATSCYIPETIVTKGFFGYLRNWERQFYTKTPIDCVRFIRRDVCPLFDETLNGPEDADHDRRVPGMKATCWAHVMHDDGETLFTYLKKKAYYAKSQILYKKKWPDDKVLDFKWRCFGVFFENGKWRKVLQRPDLFVLVLGLIFLRGIIYVNRTKS